MSEAEVFTDITTRQYQDAGRKRIAVNLGNFDTGFDCTFWLSEYHAEELMRALAEELSFDFVGDLDASDAD